VSAWRHLRAIGLLPLMATLIAPLLILESSGPVDVDRGLVPGLVLIGLGLLLVVWTIGLFARVGRGTLAPWDPTTRIVVRGPYRHLRNPMIGGVTLILVGEAALFASLPLLAWAAAFFAVNAIYMPLVEEPGLERRFGGEYERYRANVPRWLPRPRPWDPG